LDKSVNQELLNLVRDFRSNCHAAWIKFAFDRRNCGSPELWKPLPGNEQVFSFLNRYISDSFGFESLGDEWREHSLDEAEHFLITAMSYDLHGNDIWDKEKAARFFELICEELGADRRFFCNARPLMQHAAISRADRRNPVWQNGMAFYGKKLLGIVWISIHADPYTIVAPESLEENLR